MRIIAEIVDRIKTSINPDYPILLKVSCTDAVKNAGINIHNFPELADELVKTGIDALEISGNDTPRKDIDSFETQSYYAAYAEKLNIDIPVILTGGNKSIEIMETICQRGKVDFFGLGRPLIREPNLPSRWLAKVGNVECDCISCNLCLDYLLEGEMLVSCQAI